MRNHFFYTVIQDKADAPKVTGSFAMDRAIRSFEYEPGKLMILLDDFHEEKGKRQIPKANGKGFTMATYNETVYSSIYLNDEDSTRYRSLVETGAPVEQAVA